MINFINPRSDFLEKDGMMPPLGLFYLVSVLRNAGIKSRVIDLGLGDMIPEGENVFITATTPQFSEAVKAKRRYSVLGGPHASIIGESLVKDFNLVVCGEGEEVIEHIVKRKPLGIIKTKRIRNLDDLPFPDRSSAGRYHWEICGEKATTMITSRGCTGRCAFCCKAVMHGGVFFRSPQNIVDEMVYVKALGFNAVMFYDDSMAMDRGRLIELCRLSRRLKMTWRCFMRSDQVDYMVVAEMAKAGCKEVLLGVESGSNRILKNIRKHETVDQHKEAIRLIKKVGMKVKALMIVGLPGETLVTIEESRQLILETRPEELDVTILSVYPGCDIYNNPNKYEVAFGSPIHYKGRLKESQSSVRTVALSAEQIVLAQKSLYKAFNSY